MATLPSTSLNDHAKLYREFLEPYKKRVTTEISGIKHEPGTYSAYVTSFRLISNEQYTFYHCGQTKRDPSKRLAEHKSEFLNCKVTTFNAKSVMYDPRWLRGLTYVLINIEVLATGLTEAQAKLAEDEFSGQYRVKYGQFCMTNPKRGAKAS